MTRSKTNQLVTAAYEQRVSVDYECANELLRKHFKGIIYFTVTACIEHENLSPDGTRRMLHSICASNGALIVGIDEQANNGSFGDEFLRELQPFRSKLSCEHAHPCSVSARSIQAGDKPQLDGVITNDEHDRCCRGRALCSYAGHVATGCGNDGHTPRNQLRCERRQPIVLTVRPSVLDHNTMSL